MSSLTGITPAIATDAGSDAPPSALLVVPLATAHHCHAWVTPPRGNTRAKIASTFLSCTSRSNACSISPAEQHPVTSASASSSGLKSAARGTSASRCAAPTRRPCSRETPRRASSSSTGPREHHAARPFQVLAHPLGIDDHAGHDAREAAQHVVERDEAVGQDDPLDRRVRDVALVPQRDVLERGHRVGPEEPRQAHDLLAADRVALVGHRRRALLPLGERLLDLADLRLLQPRGSRARTSRATRRRSPAPSAARRAGRAG
jgi:hypothetical protein